jgi:5-deoxy-D-glucuronate isomerase
MEEIAWLYRGTDKIEGRGSIVDRSNSGLEFLRLGRIVLQGGRVPVATRDEEVVLFCLNGEGEILVGGDSYRLGKYDSLYLPREEECSVVSSGFFDVAEIAAPVSKRYPIQLVRYADVLQDPSLAKK